MAKVDISDCTSLTKDHIPMVLRRAEEFSWMTIEDLQKKIEKNTPNMYVDDYPGLRGDAQIEVAAARHAIKLKGSK